MKYNECMQSVESRFKTSRVLKRAHFSVLCAALLPLLFCLSCSGKYMGWGVLLWHTGEPGIPSGTVLPIQVRSNIEQAWIAHVPEEYSDGTNRIVEVPLPHLAFFKSRGRAEKYAGAFSELARTYAETIQDGLPIRDKPENNARRSYRLKKGEIIKILEKAEGIAAISSTGAPLEGDWFKVLTKSGSTGYCFSYRLRLFEHDTGPMGDAPVEVDTTGDSDLELVLSRIWYPESYRTMINSGRINIDALSKNYSFTAGVNDGRARIFLDETNTSFPYRKIVKTGDRSWNFDGSSLKARLLTETSLELQWEEEGIKKSAVFVTLPVSAEIIVNQEKEKRQAQFQALYVRGPGFTSSNYGTLALDSNRGFTWDEITALPEGMAPAQALGRGTVDMDYYLAGEMAERYTGALALRLSPVSGKTPILVFAYTLDSQGLRMEYIPQEYLSGRTVNRRAPAPFVIYFSTDKFL